MSTTPNSFGASSGTITSISTGNTVIASNLMAGNEQPGGGKKVENSAIVENPTGNHGAAANVATSLTTTAGNFFRKYTSQTSSGPISASIEMSQVSNKASSPEADKTFNTNIPTAACEVSSANQQQSSIGKPIGEAHQTNHQQNQPIIAVSEPLPLNIALPLMTSGNGKVSSAKVSSSKPGRAMRSRKVTRAPQPPIDSTPATSSKSTKKSVMSPTKAVQRPCQTHSFHTDAAEVQQMETVLLKLLDDFNSGKLRAFGQGCSMEQMSAIRDQQESLAKLHFEIGARQDPSAPLSEEGLRTASDNMDKLMGRLEKLSVAIGQLNPASSEKNSPSASGSSYSGLKMSFDSQKVDR